MKLRTDKWKQMEAAGDPAATGYLKEITAQAKAEGKIQDMNEAIQYLTESADKHLDKIEGTYNSRYEVVFFKDSPLSILYIPRELMDAFNDPSNPEHNNQFANACEF